MIQDTTTDVVAVVIELSQTPEDDLRSARAVHERRTCWSLLVHVCIDHGYDGLGGGMNKGGGCHACVTKPWRFFA